MSRLFLSRGASYYVRIITGLPVHDHRLRCGGHDQPHRASRSRQRSGDAASAGQYAPARAGRLSRCAPAKKDRPGRPSATGRYNPNDESARLRIDTHRPGLEAKVGPNGTQTAGSRATGTAGQPTRKQTTCQLYLRVVCNWYTVGCVNLLLTCPYKYL